MSVPNTPGDILIVDDTPANLHLLSQMLAERGHKVRPVLSGPQALTAAQAAPPDLMLLDIRMPDMDGYEVCQRLKAGERTRDIPVLFISVLSETEDKVKAFTAGGVDYITKPFQAEEVLARVQTHLALRTLQRQLQTANRTLEERNLELEARNAELEQALSTIKTLSGIVPICAWCRRKIKDDDGNWVELENYIVEHSHTQFTHGICPECREKL